MSDKNKKQELLEEGFFGSLFQLHFLQQMFGGGPEGWDPEQEEFLAAQERLPGLKKLMDKYDGDKEKCAQDPKCRSELGKIMSGMPDSLKDATREAFQTDAAEQLGEAETSILSLVEAIAQARNMILDVEPLKSMSPEQKEKALAVYDKVARPSMSQLSQIWTNLLTVIEKNKKDLPPAVAKEINLGAFESEIQKAMGAYMHLEEGIARSSSSVTDPSGVGTIGGPRMAGTGESGLSPYMEQEDASLADPSKELQKVFARISKMMTEVTTEVKTLAGYMTGTDESPFGLDKMASKEYAEKLMGLVNQIDDAFFKRLPNMIARATGSKDLKRDPEEVGPNFDPSKMDQHEKMKKAEELVMLLKKYKNEGNKEAMAAALKSINLISEPLAKKVADKYGIKLDTLNENKLFYESLGDFS